MNVKEPIGVFRAVATRDGEALARNGQPFYGLNHVWDDPRDGPIYEVLFEDGLWLLAATDDLDVDPKADIARFPFPSPTQTPWLGRWLP